MRAFILITFLEEIRREIKKLELKVSLRMARHEALIFILSQKAGKQEGTRGWGNHSIMTNSKKMKRFSRRQKILSETLSKSLLHTRFG